MEPTRRYYVWGLLSVAATCTLLCPMETVCMKRKRQEPMEQEPELKKRKVAKESKQKEDMYLQGIRKQVEQIRAQSKLQFTQGENTLAMLQELVFALEEMSGEDMNLNEQLYANMTHLMKSALFCVFQGKNSDQMKKTIEIVRLFFSKIHDLLDEDYCEYNCLYCSGPLHIAARYGNIHLANFLITQCKVDVNELDFNGMSPLFYACLHPNIRMIKLLMQKGANVNLVSPNGTAGKATPLHCAVSESPKSGNIDEYVARITFLINSGAKGAVKDCAARIAFSNLIDNCDIDDERFEKIINKCSQKLLEGIIRLHSHDADDYIDDEQKMERLRMVILAYLKNKKPGDTFYPLHYLCEHASNFSEASNLNHLIYLLFNAGIDINAKDDKQRTPLDLLVSLSDVRILTNISFLVCDLGAEITLQTVKLANKLYRFNIMVEKLRREFGKPNNNENTKQLIKDISDDINTPLHILLSYVRHIKENRVGLSLTQQHNHASMIEFFVKDGEDIHKKTSRDSSALERAKKYDEAFGATFYDFLLCKNLEKMLDQMERNDEVEEEKADCSICFDALQEKESVRLLPCNHILCLDCAKKSLMTNGSCPFCRGVAQKLEKIK